MNTNLSPEITRTSSKGHGKIANNNRFTDLKAAMFKARNQHATGTYHSKTRYGINLINA